MILQIGDKGPQVGMLQKRLTDLGHYAAKIDDDFGTLTYKAVLMWEVDTHVMGIVDDADWALMTPPTARDNDVPNGPAEVIELYGEPWHDPQGWWRKWCAPANIGLAFSHVVRVRSRGGIRGCWLYVNRDLVLDVQSIFSEIEDEGLAQYVETFDGCWNVRRIRGIERHWSTHTWGIAIDINAATNRLGQTPTMHSGIIEIFQKYGWRWGGEFQRVDGMHFQRVTGM